MCLRFASDRGGLLPHAALAEEGGDVVVPEAGAGTQGHTRLPLPSRDPSDSFAAGDAAHPELVPDLNRGRSQQ